MMTRSQAVAVATAVQQVRPEWDHPGIVAAPPRKKATALQPRSPPPPSGSLATSRSAHRGCSQPGAHWRTAEVGRP